MINILYLIPLFQDTRNKNSKFIYIKINDNFSYAVFFENNNIYKSVIPTTHIEFFKGDIIDYISPSKAINLWKKYIIWVEREIGFDLLEYYGHSIKSNELLYDYINKTTIYALENIKNNIMARKIQNKWRHVITDPQYNICKKRLLYEFNKFIIFNNNDNNTYSSKAIN